MIRRLALLVIAVLAAWLARRVAGSMGRRTPASPAIAPRFEGAMVRDRICQTFLPRERALTVRVGDEEQFFCSPRCRSAFLAGQPGQPSP